MHLLGFGTILLFSLAGKDITILILPPLQPDFNDRYRWSGELTSDEIFVVTERAALCAH